MLQTHSLCPGWSKLAEPMEEKRRSCSISDHGCTVEEVETIESALLRILERNHALSTANTSSFHGEDDFSLLWKLLADMRILKAHTGQKCCIAHGNTDAKQTFKLVANYSWDDAATAASQAAKAAAMAVENLEIMKTKLTNLSSRTRKASKTEGKEEDKAAPERRKQDKIVKAIETQNKITHWILGFMVITTAVWRFKAISFFLHVKKALSKPVQSVAGFFSDRLMGPKEGQTLKTPFEKAQKAFAFFHS